MSYKWPDKDKDEVVDYSVDWSRFLGSDTISAVTWYIDNASGIKTQVSDADTVDGIQFVQGTNTNTVATIRLGLGTNNKRYKITCKITTLGALQYERSILLRVREK